MTRSPSFTPSIPTMVVAFPRPNTKRLAQGILPCQLTGMRPPPNAGAARRGRRTSRPSKLCAQIRQRPMEVGRPHLDGHRSSAVPWCHHPATANYDNSPAQQNGTDALTFVYKKCPHFDLTSAGCGEAAPPHRQTTSQTFHISRFDFGWVAYFEGVLCGHAR